MKKILIPNATGPTNIGDHAMLQVLLDLIEASSLNKKKIVIHTKNPELYEKSFRYELSPSIYQYVVLDNRSPLVQGHRIAKVFIYLLAIKIGYMPLVEARKSDALVKLMQDYTSASVIIFTGGGYLRSRGGLKQSLNLLLQLLPFVVAKIVGSRVIVAPNSFGPFAYNWQLKLTARSLNGCDVVAVREEKSYQLLKSRGVKNLLLLSDLALLIKKSKNHYKKNKTVGFTIRNWLRDRTQQDKLENSYAQALMRLSKRTSATIQPIIQVASTDFPFEDDKESVQRVYNLFHDSDVPVSIPIKIKSVSHAAKVYGSLDLLLGMRMHSNILAAVQGTPFVAISYEHKTEGIAKQIAMEKYCISCKKVNEDSLYRLLVSAYRNRSQISNRLKATVESLRVDDMSQWPKILSIAN